MSIIRIEKIEVVGALTANNCTNIVPVKRTINKYLMGIKIYSHTEITVPNESVDTIKVSTEKPQKEFGIPTGKPVIISSTDGVPLECLQDAL